MLPLLAVSGPECVDALVLGGFRLTQSCDGAVRLEHDGRVVLVRDVPLLPSEELESILRNAGIAFTVFLDLLDRLPDTSSQANPGEQNASGARRRFRLGDTG
ncbi:MAG: hypothetical protein K0S65_4561 [Labilithrix sp.]|nr:hypothetical protein [Labilithrix sp.]